MPEVRTAADLPREASQAELGQCQALYLQSPGMRAHPWVYMPGAHMHGTHMEACSSQTWRLPSLLAHPQVRIPQSLYLDKASQNSYQVHS